MNTQSAPIFEDGTPYTCDYLYSRTRDGKWFVDDAKVQKYCKPGELGRMQSPRCSARAHDSSLRFAERPHRKTQHGLSRTPRKPDAGIRRPRSDRQGDKLGRIFEAAENNDRAPRMARL